MLKRKTLINLSVFFIALFLSLFIAELVVRAYFEISVRTGASSEKAPLPTETENWIRKWVERKVTYRNDVMNPGYPIDVFDPLLGWKLRSNFHDPYLNITSNSKGLRAQQDYSYERSSKDRIVFIGDSFTFGFGSKDNETISSYVGKKLPSVESLNMGIHGYSTTQMFLYYLNEGIQYEPDLLVMGIFWDDVKRSTKPFTHYWRPMFHLGDEEMKLQYYPLKSPTYTLIDYYENKKPRSQFIDLLKYTIHVNQEKKVAAQKGLEVNSIILKSLKKVTTEKETSFLVVLLPGENDPDEAYEIKKALISDLERFTIDYIDLYPVFEEATAKGAVLFDNHYNAQGSELVADAVIAKIKEEGYLE